MAASLVLVVLSLALTSTSALDKQIKLEDIERDNLQTEILRRPQHQTAQQEQINQIRQQQLHLQQQQQLHRQQQLAYQQQLLQQRYSAAQEPRYSASQEPRYSAPQEQQQTLTYHQQFQQQIQQHREQALLREREREREQRERERSEPQPHQTLQHYVPSQQLLQDVAAGTPHVMYLIMPGGNIAAIPIAHPNQIQALFTPIKPHYSQYQSSPVGVPTQTVQAYYQPQAVPVPTPAQAEPEHQPRTQLQYVLPSQQHRITFSQASPQYSQPQQPVVYRESSQAETDFTYTPQSQKSLYSSGVKSTAAPQLKGAAGFTTQTGSSYANFRQYSG